MIQALKPQKFSWQDKITGDPHKTALFWGKDESQLLHLNE